MTVSYQYDVASSTSGGFIRLLFRWRGSVWKLVYRELLFFTLAYFSLSMIYRFMLNDFQKWIFERIVFFCSTFMDLIPLSFVLGFYVSFIATRWWNQYEAIPWPDKLMNSIALYVPGSDETGRVLRRTLMRYLNVALVLVLRSISMAVKRRFPTRGHLVEAGFMTKLELEMLQSVPSTEFNTFWIPCTWFVNLLRESKQECRITDSNGLKLIMEEFNEFRSKCGILWSYDWISIPLVYTQVVTLATYAFFGACIFGRQYVESSEHGSHRFDFYIPVFTIFQLFFYMGLLKVAEQLINPFGDDDEDFELNWIIDRHVKVSYLGVDLLNTNPPPLVRDNYFYQQDMKLPYTEASVGYKKKTYRGSVAKMHIPEEKTHLLVPEFAEDDDEERIAATYGMGKRGASLWTLVGGQLNTRFSVSNQNLDAVSIESGSNNWKVSNPSLFMTDNTGSEGRINQEHPPGGVINYNPCAEEPVNDSKTQKIGNDIHKYRKSIPHSITEAPKAKGVKKKLAKHIPQIRKKSRQPQNRWVAFHSTPTREGDEELSLFRSPSDVKSTVSYSFDKKDPESETPPILEPIFSLQQRRQSFDERNIIGAKSKLTCTRFQSLPDVQQFAAQMGSDDDSLYKDGVEQGLETELNESTTNLLILEEDSEEGGEEEETEDGFDSLPPSPPQLVFTRPSVSRSPSPDHINSNV